MQRLKRIFKVTMMVVIFLVALGSIRSFLDRGSDRGSFRASAQSLPPLTKSTGPFHPAATEFATIDIYNPTNTPFSGSWAAYDAAGNPLIGPTSITVPAYAFSSTNFTTPLMSETRTCSSNLATCLSVQEPFVVQLMPPSGASEAFDVLSQFLSIQAAVSIRDAASGATHTVVSTEFPNLRAHLRPPD